MLAPILIEKVSLGCTENCSSIGIEHLTLSVVSVCLFALLNWLMPIVYSRFLTSENLKHLFLGSVAGILFFGYELYLFGTVYFPGVTLGMAFVALAVVYFVLANSIQARLEVTNTLLYAPVQNTDTSETNLTTKRNIIYGYLGISISLFSLAIVFLFS